LFVYCLQAAYNCDALPTLELAESNEQHLKVECIEHTLHSARQNLFSSLEAHFVDNTLSVDMLQPLKSENKHIPSTSAADVVTCSEQTGNDVSVTDSVQSIVVKLPLVARLRHTRVETPFSCIKTEIADATDQVLAGETTDSTAVVKQETAEEAATDSKKEVSEAAKGLQLARETIASIFGTEVQPSILMKIPIKRRSEKASNELDDRKRSRTSGDDMHDHSSNQHRGWYVLDQYNAVHICDV